MLAIGAFAAYEAAKLPFGSAHQPDSGFFPSCTAILLIAFALATLIPGLRAARHDEHSDERPSPSLYVAAVVVGLVLYALLLKAVGFLFCTFALVVVMLRFPGSMKWGPALTIALPSVVACYALFTRLGVPLPAGIAGF